jgi:hypothetical protein
MKTDSNCLSFGPALVENGSEFGSRTGNHAVGCNRIASLMSTGISQKVSQAGLVAKSLHWDNCAMPKFQSMAERALFAWQCLPRDERGLPPGYRELERANGLPVGTLSKLIKGVLVRPGLVRLEKISGALSTTSDWLQFERGAAPKPASRAVSEISSADRRAHAEKTERLMQRGDSRRTRKASK